VQPHSLLSSGRSCPNMSAVDFGPFNTAFESTGLDVPGYLTLLNLQDDHAQLVIDRIAQALQAGRTQEWVTAMLTDFNWRPHLVAAMALLLDQSRSLDTSPLWVAIDGGSWVTPQLVVTALFSDATFATKAAQRMETGCLIHVPPALDPILRHVATGPSGPTGRSGKMAASILAVCARLPGLASRESTWRAAPQLQAALAEDRAYDGSHQITVRWLAAVSAHFQKRGILLAPP
jgi:hypothetical protein